MCVSGERGGRRGGVGVCEGGGRRGEVGVW